MNKLNENRLIEQIAYRLLAFNDSKKAAAYIYDCMNMSSYGTPEDISATQALFMEVTKCLSTIDKDYSLDCSKEYLKIIKDNFGDLTKQEESILKGDDNE